jgi:hypothetical protein
VALSAFFIQRFFFRRLLYLSSIFFFIIYVLMHKSEASEWWRRKHVLVYHSSRFEGFEHEKEMLKCAPLATTDKTAKLVVKSELDTSRCECNLFIISNGVKIFNKFLRATRSSTDLLGDC